MLRCPHCRKPIPNYLIGSYSDSIGGNTTAKRGQKYFRKIAAMRKNRKGGRPRKENDALCPTSPETLSPNLGYIKSFTTQNTEIRTMLLVSKVNDSPHVKTANTLNLFLNMPLSIFRTTGHSKRLNPVRLRCRTLPFRTSLAYSVGVSLQGRESDSEQER